MNDGRSQKRWGPIRLFFESRRFRWVVILFVVLPILYAASFGPACWISDRGLLPENVVYHIYSPIVDLCVSAESLGFRRAMIWYGQLLPTPQPKTGPERWSTVENILYATLIKRLPRDEPE